MLDASLRHRHRVRPFLSSLQRASYLTSILRCTVVNQWYSQCIRGTASSTTSASNPGSTSVSAGLQNAAVKAGKLYFGTATDNPMQTDQAVRPVFVPRLIGPQSDVRVGLVVRRAPQQHLRVWLDYAWELDEMGTPSLTSFPANLTHCGVGCDGAYARNIHLHER